MNDAAPIFAWFGLAAIGMAGAVVSRHWFVGAIVGAVLFLTGVVLVGPAVLALLDERRDERRLRKQPPAMLPAPRPVPVLTGVVVPAITARAEPSDG